MRNGIDEGIEALHKNQKSQCICIVYVLLVLQRKMSSTCSISSHVEVETTNSSC